MKNKRIIRKLLTAALAVCLLFSLAGAAFASSEPSSEPSGEIATTAGGILGDLELFTDRDLSQEVDVAKAETFTVTDGQEINIADEGTYVLKGSAANVTVYVKAGKEDKVQLVLDGVTITNTDSPCIHVQSADKVFITVSADSALSVTGKFASKEDSKADGVIFARSDVTLNGTAKLTINSSDNGVVCKDDLKITGGTFEITAADCAIEANDSIRIGAGTLVLNAESDGLHAENSDDDSLGYIYIGGGSIEITAEDDAIHAVSVVQINNGTVAIEAAEGIEGTYIQLNGGEITINSKDDGINAASKSEAYTPTLEINDGTVTVVNASSKTDAIDCNGDIIVNGGTIDVTGASAFDYDGTDQLNGGTVIVNGQQVNSLTNQKGK